MGGGRSNNVNDIDFRVVSNLVHRIVGVSTRLWNLVLVSESGELFRVTAYKCDELGLLARLERWHDQAGRVATQAQDCPANWLRCSRLSPESPRRKRRRPSTY